MQWFLVISWMFIDLDLFTVNAVKIESGMKASYCDNPVTSMKMFDGDKSLSNFELLSGKCEDASIVDISLDDPMTINYVIVFEGKGNDYEELDFFIVRLSRQTKVELCSIYPGTARKENGRGLRVNCRETNAFHQEVSIESQTNTGFKISEIEVHSLAPVRSKQHVAIHRGCFQKFGIEDNPPMFVTCDAYCLSKSKIFAGRKKKFCACSNVLHDDHELPIHNCNVTCEDDESRYCGGVNAYSVYLIKSPLPYHVSCIKGSKLPQESAFSSVDMTVAQCLWRCEPSKYANLLKGDTCICNDDNPPEKDYIGVNELSCSTKCVGDPNIVCGGENVASMYATCLRDFEDSEMKCSQFMQCADFYDMYGDCGGACKFGYIGDHCLEREDPEEHIDYMALFWSIWHYLAACLILFLIMGCLICTSTETSTLSSPSSPSS